MRMTLGRFAPNTLKRQIAAGKLQTTAAAQHFTVFQNWKGGEHRLPSMERQTCPDIVRSFGRSIFNHHRNLTDIIQSDGARRGGG
jgi:hypothetical protein